MDSQYNNYSQEPTPTTQHPEHMSTKKFVVIIIAITFLWLASSITGLYLWNKEKQKVARLNNEVSSLKVTDDKAKLPETNNQSNSSNQKPAEQTPSYSAKVGKFTLTLPAGYGIVNEHDGGGEGTASTHLLIGKSVSNSVVTSDSYGRVEITAYIDIGNQTEDALIKQELTEKPEAAKQPLTSIAGINAQTYTSQGLFSTKTILFKKGEIFYIIEAVNIDNPEVPKDLEAVIAGFKFN